MEEIWSVVTEKDEFKKRGEGKLNARLTFSDCHYSDARNTINDTPTESTFTSYKIKLKVRETLEVEQPVGSVSLALVGTFRTLRTSYKRTQTTVPRNSCLPKVVNFWLIFCLRKPNYYFSTGLCSVFVKYH